MGLTIRKQAYTLAITDCFWVIAFSALICLLAVASVRSLDIQYKHVIAAAKSQSALSSHRPEVLFQLRERIADVLLAGREKIIPAGG